MAGASLKYRLAFKAIHDVLIREWDPIGVGYEPNAQDEYDSYIPTIYRLISEGADDMKIAEHLEQIETDSIGLSFTGDRVQIARRLREVVRLD
jgi:hypothetical protein